VPGALGCGWLPAPPGPEEEVAEEEEEEEEEQAAIPAPHAFGPWDGISWLLWGGVEEIVSTHNALGCLKTNQIHHVDSSGLFV